MVNGAEGIGTGWATSAPNYNPRTIISNLKKYLRCEPVDEMWCPWYRGFRGSIVRSADKMESFDNVGVIEKRGPTSLEITELPIKKWTQDYKEFLQGLLPTEGPGSGEIEDFKEYHTERSVHFIITVTEAQMQKLERTGFEKAFKLRSTLATSNMMFFDKDGKIQKFTSEQQILESFAELRLQYYFKRKDFLLERLRQQQEILSEKARFIEMVITEKLKVKNRKREALIEDLKKNNFRTSHEITEGDDIDMPGSEDDDGNAPDEQGTRKSKKRSGGWDYLLGMPLWSLTKEKVEELKKQLETKAKEVEELEFTAPEELWERDLDAILDELDAIDLRASMSAEEEKKINRSAKRPGTSALSAAKRHRGASSSAPPVPMSSISRGGVTNSSAFMELQERQLSSSSGKFPTLFQDLRKSCLMSAPGAVAASASKPIARGASFGSFAQRSGQARSRGPGAEDNTSSAEVSGVQGSAICPGAAVTIHGLSVTDLNNRRGTVRRRDEDSGRWEVEVEGQGVKRLKLENLRLVGSGKAQ